jgi:hypothetical protein
LGDLRGEKKINGEIIEFCLSKLMDIGNSISELYTGIAGEGSSRVTDLADFSSLSLSGMLLVTGGGSGTSFVPLSLSE